MTGEPEQGSGETRAGAAPVVIHLPDLRQLAKKVTSGSGKRRRRHLEQFRTDDAEHEALHEKARACGMSLGAYVRSATLGAAGPRARRRAPVDVTALTQALVAFSRGTSLLNQATRAVNGLALIGGAHGYDRLADETRELRREIDKIKDSFAAPIAAILAALSHDSEG